MEITTTLDLATGRLRHGFAGSVGLAPWSGTGLVTPVRIKGGLVDLAGCWRGISEEQLLRSEVGHPYQIKFK